MHIAEVVTIAKSLPLLRLNTYKSLILSYSADYRRIFGKNTTQPSVTGRSNVPLHYICCRGRHSPTDRCKARGYWNLRCTKYVFSLFNSPFSISVCNHPGSIRQASILGKNTITSSPWHSTYMPSSSRFTSSTL